MNESGTKFYTDLEVELLINEISEAALEAIEQAAGEAAKAATLASIEREAEVLHEAQRWRLEAEAVKNSKIKTAVLTGIITFLSGFTTGIILIGVTK